MNDPALLLEDDRVSRLRALEPASFIVEAPAGAGKTELLTQRVLKLLAGVSEPEEIVAITFTLKAAAEMKSRILESLEMAARADIDPDRLAPHKRITFDLSRQALAASAAHGWNLLDNPNRLRILTVDALCASLARQMPFLSRFGAQPRMADDARLHYREAVRRTLALLAEEGEGGAGGYADVVADVVTEALRYLDNDAGRLGGLLAAMLIRRDQWLRHALAHAADYGRFTSEAAQQGLAVLVQAELQGIAAAFDGRVQARLMPLARAAAGNLRDGDVATPISALLDWSQPLTGEPDELPLWRGICELLLTRDGGFRKAFNKNQGLPPGKPGEASKQALKELIASLPESFEALLAGLRELPDPHYTDAEWHTVAALAQLLKLAAVQLWTVFNEAGEADFIEVAQRALQALGAEDQPSDLALQLDYRIQHLLVDEFQDTSPIQVQLLQRLTAAWMPGEGRTLFLVGDPMQSIYRFRKADVGLFLNAADFGIGAIALERLRLCRNNRSCPAVVDWVNAAFGLAFPTADKVTEGAIRYRDFVPTRAALPGAGVFVAALVVDGEMPGETVERLEARRVLNIIEQARRDDPSRSVAVLVRARDHLAPLVAEIRRTCPELRFQAVEIERLAERQPVQDLLALTQALHHRADRVNWLAILRAPWCGLTLADLHALAADDHAATIWSLMNNDTVVARLSADGQSRLRHVRGVLAEAYAQRGRQSPRRWVEGVWTMLGGTACLLSAADAGDAKAFLDLIDQLDNAGSFTPEHLAAQIGELHAAPDALADGSLQFMTIHKSKGLEFDTVILPGMHRKTPAEEHALMLWEEVALDGLDEQLVVAPYSKRGRKGDAQPTPYDYLRRLNRLRADNEAARVLYVAATRAIRALHLVGVARLNADGELAAPTGSFLKLLWPALADTYAAAAVEAASPGAIATADVPKLRRLVAPTVPEILRRTAPQMQQDVEPIPSVTADAAPAHGETVDALAANVGTLAHAYLEMIARSGVEAWSNERLRALQPAMALWLSQRGHVAMEARQGAARASEVLQTTLASDAGRWVLKSRATGVAELAVNRMAGEPGREQVSTHIVDRSFVEDGQRWIIDYKTAQVPDGDVDSVLQAHAERYRAQLERYGFLFDEEGLPQRLAIFYAAHGRLVELKGELKD
ncbi:MAG: UvrD-helicase domain-containing protein [Proteobacteria bacterium]|nr:UvrD-helicase domain-containing protein [Pseudomonadota bacterium]